MAIIVWTQLYKHNRDEYTNVHYGNDLWMCMVQLRIARDRSFVALFAFVLLVHLLIGLCFVQTTYAYSGPGDGTIDSPYQITSCLQLQEMENNLAANYVLTKDIDCTDTINWNDGRGFNSVGNRTTKFVGSFDGRGHAIKNLYINRPDEDNVGLLGVAGASLYIRNFSMEHATIAGKKAVGTIGRIDANWNTVVKNISVDSDSLFTSGYESAPMTYGYGVGSIVGAVLNARIEESQSKATVDAKSMAAGGLVGYDWNTDILSSSFTGKVTGGIAVGGITGWYYYGGRITNVYSAGQVEAYYFTGDYVAAGGIIGILESGIADFQMKNSYSAGSVTSEGYAGGLMGGYYPGTDIWSLVENNFTVASIDARSGQGAALYGVMMANAVNEWSDPSSVLLNNYYDKTTTGQNTCFTEVYEEAWVMDFSHFCHAVNTDGSEADYFYDTTNDPYGEWDFENIWIAREGALPILYFQYSPPDELPDNKNQNAPKTTPVFQGSLTSNHTRLAASLLITTPNTDDSASVDDKSPQTNSLSNFNRSFQGGQTKKPQNKSRDPGWSTAWLIGGTALSGLFIVAYVVLRK